EQTGRMNRLIDYRTDFYSLGVTFYELLAGELPFEANEAMELVHSHIAKIPDKLSNRKKDIPQVLCEIVMKLMAKNAEDRYQSALRLKFDLENCLAQLKETGRIESFDIAKRDLCDRFIIPDKLYGREAEVSTLLQAFDRVSKGTTEMMLVAGFSGIGKTAVVNEVHKPIVKQRGYFIKGKFDQFQRNIPFNGFVQAFRNLMGQLLTENDSQIQQWKNKILEILGENGQVIIDVVPELENIIGAQPPAVELSGTAAQNRFNLLFQKFTQLFTSLEHPLVIFLDDLQWADLASLKLMQLLMVDTGYLLLIGAYRDNEVNPGHPLMLNLNDIQRTHCTINTITLAPLNQEQLNQLVADTLKCKESLALPLSRLVFQKTQGNPFFATQFLKALQQENIIQFNFELGYWQCDIAQIKTQAVTDDVVNFMALQLGKLPRLTQQVLQIAACIGNQFDIATLAIVLEKSELETAKSLWKALQEGLILPISDVYKFYQGEDNERFILSPKDTSKRIAKYQFLHDRVQQAAYFLIPDDQKTPTHLKIGQLLLQNLSEIEQEEKLFDIVEHLNLAQELIVQPRERQALAELNLRAGVKARNSTAYPAARVYLQIGIDLLQANSWSHQYELALNLYLTSAEVSYLNGDFEGMEQQATLVLQQAKTVLDKVKIYEIQIAAKTLQSYVLEAIDVGRTALLQLGIELPKESDKAEIGKAVQTLANQLENIEVETLINLPLTNDAETQSAMHIMGILFAPVIQGMPSLLPWLSSKMVSLSLQFGNTISSTIGYALHGLVMSAFFADAVTGYAFGKVALNLLEKFNSQKIKPIVMFLFGNFIQPHREPLRDSIQTLKVAYDTGIDTGDFMHAGFSLATHSNSKFFSGEELDSFVKDMANYSVALAQIKQYAAQAYVNLGKQTAENLIEPVSQPHYLTGNTYSETVMLPKHRHDNDQTAIVEVYIYKLILAYIFGNYADAINYVAEAQLSLKAVSGSIFVPIFYFYAALTHLTRILNEPEKEQAEILAIVKTYQTILVQFAHHAPMNQQHKVDLVEAEKHRILGKNYEAADWYDRAIAGAKANKYIQEEALANELAAKFYLNLGREKFAELYMQQAYYCYAKWGAKAKIDDLEKLYPHLLKPIFDQKQINLHPQEKIISSSAQISSLSSTHISDALDFISVLKAAQTISSSIELDQLITNLTQITLENSGAKKSLLILPQDDIWQVRAVTSINSQNQIQTLLKPKSLDTFEDIPTTIINYVKNIQQPIVIDNCQTDIPGLIGEYMLTYQPQSVLCTPIINQGNLVAILYLENQTTSEVFTTERLEVINLLASQSAISLENARLYQKAQQALHDLQQAQLQIVQSEKMSALGNLVAGVAHEMNNPLGFISASLKQAKPIFSDIAEHLQIYQETFPNQSKKIQSHAEEIDLDYSLEDFPKMLGSMTTACERLTNISNSLRTFSRSDQDYKVPFDIHSGIDSTLLILKHRLKANAKRAAIEVVTNYANLPEIECFPGQLNQVFMNILGNAIDALEESNNGLTFEEIQLKSNLIKITTILVDNCVQIIIADNGIGIDETVKQKIFDHLFTTKHVGKGTGLGLAISRKIVEETHGGKLTCHSVFGEGTEFIIQIPL
ncbi:AAA family ATPase, partial [Aetokthonos hydrillicola]